MKHFLFVDGARNCAYSIYEVSDEDFFVIFPGPGQDIEFSSDLSKRIGKDAGWEFIRRIYLYPVDKKRPLGIDGTIFHKLDFKRAYYPTKRESDLDDYSRLPLTTGAPPSIGGGPIDPLEPRLRTIRDVALTRKKSAVKGHELPEKARCVDDAARSPDPGEPGESRYCVIDRTIVSDWVRSSTHESTDKTFKDIHFDELFGIGEFPSRADSLIRFSAEVVMFVADFLESESTAGQFDYVAVSLPVRWRKRGLKKSWRKRDWRRLDNQWEPPNLMLMKAQVFLGFAERAYYKKLISPVETAPRIEILFQSWIGNYSTHNEATTVVSVYTAVRGDIRDS